MKNIIEIKNLKKYFNQVKAVDDISFTIMEGQLFALLGLNGAGKSTTINILSGILNKDSGEVFLDGFSVDKDIRSIAERVGVVFQNSVLDKDLTVMENLRYRAGLYDLTKNQFNESLDYLSKKLEFSDILNRTFSKLSGGQKRRIDIARALIHKPKVLILDEPTTGLDPKTRILVWSLVAELRKTENLTVLLTTHYMEETADADNVVIMDSGKIVACGTPVELKNKYANDLVRVYSFDKNLPDLLKANGNVWRKENEFLEIEFDNILQAKEFVVKNADLIFDLEIIKGKMDNVFLNVTGKSLKENI